MANFNALFIIAITIANCIINGCYATALEDQIAHLLERYRDTITGGNWILPTLDPLVWDHENFHYIDEKIQADMNVTVTAYLHGWSQYRVDSVKVDNNKFTIVMNIETSKSEGELDSIGQFGKHLPINGHANYTATSANEVITFSGQIGANTNGFMQLENFKVLMHFDKIKADVDGFTGGKIYNRLISALLTSAGAPFLNREDKFFSSYVSPFFHKILNPAFNQFTYDQLMDLINSS